MAPRRTSIKPPKTAAAEAATFDFDAFLSGFVRPEFTASLIQRNDLSPKLAEQQRVLDDLDDRIERLEKAEGEDGQERDITAVDPLSVLTERRNRLTLEYNELAQEYNDSAVSFTFRVPDKKDDHLRIQAMMDEIGAVQPETPKPHKTGNEEVDTALDEADQVEFEKVFSVWWDALAIRSMSVTCTKHPGTALGAPPLTVDQWEALRDKVGAVSFNTLGTAWFEAVQAIAPAAPFLPRPSLSPAPAG